MKTQDTPQILLAHHLKALRLPVFTREWDKTAAQCATDKADYPTFLLRLAELELLELLLAQGSLLRRGQDARHPAFVAGVELP